MDLRTFTFSFSSPRALGFRPRTPLLEVHDIGFQDSPEDVDLRSVRMTSMANLP